MRRDVEFDADGVTLRGWLYLPDGRRGKVPAVVMAHGFSAVKEMYLDRFGERFSEAGLGALVYDNRNTGASDGEPRQELDPWEQVRDYRTAITFARTLPEVDRDRIGVWGTSYSGGHVIVLGAIDKRIKCVVGQVPLISGRRNAARLVRSDLWAWVREQFDADREARFNGKPPGMIPVVSKDPNTTPCCLPTPDSWDWFTETGRTLAPAWRNEVTLRSLEMFPEYEPGAYIEDISPTPFLMVAAARDHLTVVDEALAAYNRAREPKKLCLLSGFHFDAYTKQFNESSQAAADFFVEHLGSGG